jgi:hypothetical protein
MAELLPSFQIDVMEVPFNKGKSITHKIAVNTNRLIKTLLPDSSLPDHITIEKAATVINEPGYEKSFYSKMATELSMLDNQQLMANFSDIRICFKHNRSVKTYQFKFDW